MRRQLGEWKPPALAKKGNSSSATKYVTCISARHCDFTAVVSLMVMTGCGPRLWRRHLLLALQPRKLPRPQDPLVAAAAQLRFGALCVSKVNLTNTEYARLVSWRFTWVESRYATKRSAVQPSKFEGCERGAGSALHLQ